MYMYDVRINELLLKEDSDENNIRKFRVVIILPEASKQLKHCVAMSLPVFLKSLIYRTHRAVVYDI